MCPRNSEQAWQPRVLVWEAESGATESAEVRPEGWLGPGWEGLCVLSKGVWILSGEPTKLFRKFRHSGQDWISRDVVGGDEGYGTQSIAGERSGHSHVIYLVLLPSPGDSRHIWTHLFSSDPT